MTDTTTNKTNCPEDCACYNQLNADIFDDTVISLLEQIGVDPDKVESVAIEVTFEEDEEDEDTDEGLLSEEVYDELDRVINSIIDKRLAKNVAGGCCRG